MQASEIHTPIEVGKTYSRHPEKQTKEKDDASVEVSVTKENDLEQVDLRINEVEMREIVNELVATTNKLAKRLFIICLVLIVFFVVAGYFIFKDYKSPF